MSVESVTALSLSLPEHPPGCSCEASDPLHTHVARTLREIPFTPDEWNHLASISPTATVFQTYEWFESWWTSFGSDGQLLLISVFQGDKLLGFAPLMRYPSLALRPQVLRFVADTHSDYLDFITGSHAPVVLREVFKRLTDHESSWSELHLRNIPASSPSVQLLESFSSNQELLLLRGTDMPCFSLQVGGREEDVRRRVNKYSLRRASNYFGRQGHLTVRTVDTVSEGKDLLPVFFNQHIRRWSTTGTPSLFHETQNQHFYDQLVTRLLPLGWLHLSVAELDGQPIAFHFGFDHGGTLTWYKPSFDPDHAAHSPGKLILSHLMHFALDSNRSEVDFTIGAEPFKERYCDTQRVNVQYHIYANRPIYYLALVRDFFYRILRSIMRRLGLASWLRGRLSQ